MLARNFPNMGRNGGVRHAPGRDERPLGKPVVHVAVAVIQHADGTVLLAQRPKHKLSGGCWEFPGGKVEPNETPVQALIREVNEEVGILPERMFAWCDYQHDYGDKRVHLHVFRVSAWRGEAHGREGQPISWEDPASINVAPLLAANERIRALLALPQVIVNLDPRNGVAACLDGIRQYASQGVTLFKLADKGCTPGQLGQLAQRAVIEAHQQRARLIVNGDETLARRVHADGMALPARKIDFISRRPAVRHVVARCENASDLAWAAAHGADFVVLGLEQDSQARWRDFAAMIVDFPLPVYAWGNLDTDALARARDHGAHGVVIDAGGARQARQ